MPGRSAFTCHGGALDAARRAWPNAPGPWLDLSTGINPIPYPVGTIEPEAWARLPDADGLARLEALAAARDGVPQGRAIVAAPGSQAVVQRLPDLLGAGLVRVLGPTYGEFAAVFARVGATVETVATPEALAGADIAIVVNPNNPDGRLLAPSALRAIAARVGTLVVDEAFADALPDAPGIGPVCAPDSAILVLRSFGKIHGLAGLRLGFAVADAETASRLRDLLGPWAVGGPAIACGLRALADEAWLARTRARLQVDGARLAALLDAAGAVPVGATPLFRLVSHPCADALFEALARRGILVRPFAREPGWLRFGLPGAEADWARLEAALGDVG